MSFPTSFVAIDCETADKNEICQIAAVLVEDGVIKDEKCCLVRPYRNHYSHFNIKIHHIRPSMTEAAPKFPEVWAQIEPWVLSARAVAFHYAPADTRFITSSLARHDESTIALRNAKVIDTCLEACNASLYSCCKFYDVPLESHHDALCDARACAQLVLKMNGQPRPMYIPYEIEPTEPASTVPENVEVLYPATAFTGKTIVLTGDFYEWPDRNELVVFLRQCGARITRSLSSKTDYLFRGVDPGPEKIIKAEELISDGHKLIIVPQKKMDEMIKKVRSKYGIDS